MNLSQIKIFETLQNVFDDVFIEKINLRSDLTANEVPEWDSLTHITLIINIEKTLGIRFRVGEVESTQNVGELANLIIKRIQEK